MLIKPVDTDVVVLLLAQMLTFTNLGLEIEVDFDLGTNVIDVYINYLRKKIELGFSSKIIKTVIGMGYVIKEQ